MASKTDLMIDIETLSKGSGALITQVGAVFFDRETGELGQQYKANINAVDAEKRFGMKPDADTVYWWLKQDDRAIESFTRKPHEKIDVVMQRLKEMSKEAGAVWSHATFDFVILQEAIKKVGMNPMSYRKARDIRTLVDLANFTKRDNVFTREGTHHDALDDAIFQIKYCVAAMKKLRAKNNEAA